MKIIGRFFSKKDKEDLAAKSAMIGAAGLGASKLGHIVAEEATYNNFMKEKRDKSLIDKILQEAKKTNPSLKISGDSYEDIIEDIYSKDLRQNNITPEEKKSPYKSIISS